MKTIQPGVLDDVVRRLVEEFDPEQIILFGSHAWGTPDEDSDLDLMVIVSESDESPVRRAQRAHHALASIGAPKDVLVSTRQEFDRRRTVYASLEALVLERGKVLYERQG